MLCLTCVSSRLAMERRSRPREVSSDNPIEKASSINAATSSPELVHRRRSVSDHVKSNWDSLLWVFAAFAVFYFTNFGSTLVFNEAVNGTWLFISAVSLLVSMGCMAYAVLYLPALHSDNWRERAPVLIPVATVGGLIGGICLAIAVWPVWKLYSLIILFVLFMGSISILSLVG